MERVVLVNERDIEIGLAEKQEAHLAGLLHRAFSIVLFNHEGKMLLQRRALSKYHGGGLWSNACCSHPRPGEKLEDAVKRRVKEELGMECTARFLFKTKYNFDMENGLREHELDHVFTGTYWEAPNPDPNEIEDLKLVEMEELNDWMNERPEDFSPWFKHIQQKISLEKVSPMA